MVDKAIPVCALIDRYEYPSSRNLITRDSFKGLILGLPPKLFPFNLLFKTFSFFLSLRHSLSKLFNSHKILKTIDDVFAGFLLVKNPDKVRNWIS